MEGELIWMKAPVKLRWWSLSIGTYELMNGPKTTWVRIVGLPLHLWSQFFFRIIGEYCGGWAETEEETALQNHIKWARIGVHGDGSNISKEVTIENKGVLFTMQLWAEAPTKISFGEERSNTCITQHILDRNPLDKMRCDPD